MSDEQRRLIVKALAKYGAIYPCFGKSGFDECFTAEFGILIFWFNSTDNSTHVVTEGMPVLKRMLYA